MAFALIAVYLDWARFGYRACAADYISIWTFPDQPSNLDYDWDADLARLHRYQVLALECGDAMRQGRR